jgi:hypothetical protein
MDQGKIMNRPKSDIDTNKTLEKLLGRIDTKLFIVIILLVGILIVALADL